MKTKKLFITIFLILLILFPYSFVFSADTTTSEPPSINAYAALVMDNRTNKVLYSKQANRKLFPASTTKILTAILTMENCNLDDLVTASYDSVMSIPDGYSTAHIQIGEQLTVEQLLELLLVISANDAANVLAEHVGGSMDSFVSMMNTKLSDLQLNNSHFTNSYGRQDDNHYTTAHDMIYLMKYCLQNETFRRIAGQASCSIPATNMSAPRTYNSSNQLLIPQNSNYNPYVTTGKTGFTTQAKQCLVSSAYKDDLELLCVVLGSDDRFADTNTLYEYAYSNYSIKNIVNEGDVVNTIDVNNATSSTKSLDLLVSETIPALVNNSFSSSDLNPEFALNATISAPIEEGAVLGKVTYTIDGVSYTTDIVASHSVEKIEIFVYFFYGIGLFVFLLLIYWIFFHKNKNKNEKII